LKILNIKPLSRLTIKSNYDYDGDDDDNDNDNIMIIMKIVVGGKSNA